MPQSFGESFVEGGVSNIKGLTEAIFNLPNVDISAIKQQVYKKSSDFIKYTTDSQYRDSVNQEVVYDFKTDIAYGQILALQGDADKIGQVVGEASGKLASDLALSVATAGVGKVANQTIKTINKVDGDAITSNIPNNSDGIITLSKSCSFDGSMQVKTLFGYKPISQIQLKDWVFSKNELTGKTNYRQVLQTIKSIDPDTTRITIVNSNGIKQTIISDGLHPYFVDFTGDTTPPKPSTGHHYKGNLPYAYWVGAKDIEIGHRLIDDKGNYQTVIAIHTKSTPLDSYNLEVDTDHTFFIKGIDGVDSVWVHNDCYRQLPNGSKKQPDGTYIANVNGKQITLIETKVGNETVYYTKDHKEGDPYRNKAGKMVDEKGKFIIDPTAKVHQPKPTLDDYDGQGRPSPQQSEQDVGKMLPIGAREQVSFKDGKEVDYGTPNSVRPDWCIGNTCSIEVKNYDIHDNRNGLINIIAEQAIERENHLPKGMVQRVVIDLRGQAYTDRDILDIKKRIVDKSEGKILNDNIEFIFK